MTDDQLDLVMQKLKELAQGQKELKRQVVKATAELKAMDEIILDEVERVHELLNVHVSDKSKHSA